MNQIRAPPSVKQPPRYHTPLPRLISEGGVQFLPLKPENSTASISKADLNWIARYRGWEIDSMRDGHCLLRFLKGDGADRKLPHYFLSLLSIIFSLPPIPFVLFWPHRTIQPKSNHPLAYFIHRHCWITAFWLHHGARLTMTLVGSDARVKERSHL